MAINVTPTSKGPGGTAQPASLFRSLLRPPEGPRFPPLSRRQRAAAAGHCAGLGGRSLPGNGSCPPGAARCCSASEGEAALRRPLGSRLPPSPAGSSRQRAAGRRRDLYALAEGYCRLARRHRRKRCWASEAALCQGAPDWLTGLCNGYLVRVKASDWSRGTCNASSGDAVVRVPERCRGATAAPPGMAARGRRCPQHRHLWALSALLGSIHGPAEDFPPLRTAAACSNSNSNCFAPKPELAGRSCSSVRDLFRADFLLKKGAERQSLFSQFFSTAQSARGAQCGRSTLLMLPLQCPVRSVSWTAAPSDSLSGSWGRIGTAKWWLIAEISCWNAAKSFNTKEMLLQN